MNKALIIANDEFDVTRVMALITDEEKIRRVKRLYDVYDILDILGYNDESMSAKDIQDIDSVDNYPVIWENLIYKMAINNGNFEEAIARNMRLPI